MMRLADIQIRDPFIVPVAEEGAYFLYGTTDHMCWKGRYPSSTRRPGPGPRGISGRRRCTVTAG